MWPVSLVLLLDMNQSNWVFSGGRYKYRHSADYINSVFGGLLDSFRVVLNIEFC